MAGVKKTTESVIPKILQKHQKELLKDWMKEQLAATTLRPDLLKEKELYGYSDDFLDVFTDAAQKGNLADIHAPEWKKVREALEGISRIRMERGFSPSETATFIFSLKQPLMNLLLHELGNDPQVFAHEMWVATALLDKLGLYSVESYQVSREKVILRQQQEMIEISTPVVKLWEGILAIPVIGTMDSARTQVMMENLLQCIMETGSTVAIIDITGVPAVDTLVAQHLLKTVSAARLMGAECIVSGIRPQIAQTVVTLGVELGGIITKATLADAFFLALKTIGMSVTPAK
jgi:rsbT co-antagonist protein RsbR